MQSPPLQKFPAVAGYNQKVNDVIFVPPQNTTTDSSSSVVIFFGGDVQDYAEQMKSHRDHGRYADEYSLEKAAEILASKYPLSYIVIIKASKMELKTFSCYQNFVPCNNIGTPAHQENANALLHLTTLLLSVDQLTQNIEIGWNTPITLIGFSKGCVVLNQLIHELHFFHSLPVESGTHVALFMKRLKKMIWLDGGHSGGSNTWITSSKLISVLSTLGIAADIHVTPYQIRDERRPWIGKEEKLFYANLKKLGVNVSRKFYFEDETPSLEKHFLLLKQFG